MTTWLLLALSLFLLGFNRSLSLLTLAITAMSGFIAGIITWQALPVIFIIILLAFAYSRYKTQPYLRAAIILTLIIIASGLTFHFIPGFNNMRYIPRSSLGIHSAPFSFYLNTDKALLPFILLIFTPMLFVCTPLKKVSKLKWGLLCLAVPALLFLAVALGGLAIEPHWPEWLPVFILANLFFVCLAEEALFRGVIQQYLSRYLPPYVALIIAATLFGLAHFTGGLLLVIFALLAGIIYGLAWMWSGRLWVAVIFHFALNLMHLLLFTYPFKIA